MAKRITMPNLMFDNFTEKYVPDGKNLYKVVELIGESETSRIYKAEPTKAGREIIEENLRDKIRNAIRERIISQEGCTPDDLEEKVEEQAAEIRFNQEHIALKVTLKEITANKQTSFEDRIALEEQKQIGVEREASIKSLRPHPNNVAIYDTGLTHYGHNYVAEEIVEDAFDSVCLPNEEAVQAIIQSAKGLAEFHKQNLVHRDPKPPNMLITVKADSPEKLKTFKDYERDLKAKHEHQEKGLEHQHKNEPDPDKKRKIRARIFEAQKEMILSLKKKASECGIKVESVKNCDFDIVKPMTAIEGVKTTKKGLVKGTPLYMSPEALKEDYSPRSDIYALGASLYEMLTGETLYNVADPVEKNNYLKMSEMISDPTICPVNPRKFNPHVNKDLVKIIAKCIHPAKSFRYKTVDELIRDLNRWDSNRRYPNWRNNWWKVITDPKLLATRSFWRYQDMNKADYTPFVFTNAVDVEKRRKGILKRATQTAMYMPRVTYQRAHEKVAEIESPIMRNLAKYGVYIMGGLLATAVAGTIWAGYLAYNVFSNNNQPKESQNIEKVIEVEENGR